MVLYLSLGNVPKESYLLSLGRYGITGGLKEIKGDLRFRKNWELAKKTTETEKELWKQMQGQVVLVLKLATKTISYSVWALSVAHRMRLRSTWLSWRTYMQLSDNGYHEVALAFDQMYI